MGLSAFPILVTIPATLSIYPLKLSINPETASSVNQCLHQLCGGWFKGTLYSQEKLLWLKKYISKSKGKTAIMAYFIEEQEELSKIFKDCTILSSTKYCEGIAHG